MLLSSNKNNNNDHDDGDDHDLVKFEATPDN